MNSLLLIFVSLLISSHSLAKPFIYGGYGMSRYVDSGKAERGFGVRKQPMKFTIGQRFGHLEFELGYRVANGEAEFIHDDTKNSIIHRNSAVTAGFGVYTIPALRIGAGLAFQNVKETLKNNVTAAQEAGITEAYTLTSNQALGSYVTIDCHLFSISKVRILFSGTAYFNPGLNRGKEYEGVLGFKFPFGGGGRSSGANPLRSMSER